VSAPTNGRFPTSEVDAAGYYLARRLAPVPLLGRTKKVTFDGWPEYRADPDDLGRFAGNNLGLLLGGPSNGTYDVDLDCPEAVAAADVLLPATGLVFGRKTAPRAHRLYVCTTEPESLALADPARDPRHPGGRMLVELRGGGKQTMAPPSLHPDTGEQVEWELLGEPAGVSAADLERAVKAVAAAALLGRYWPTGDRHFAALALAGGLVRAWGGEVGRVKEFVRAVLTAAGDPEAGDRVRAVDDTAEALAAGKKDVTGWPTLAGKIGTAGRAVVDKVTEWLGVTPSGERTATGCGGREETPLPPPPPWPGPLADEALYGLTGDVVRALAPHTEADPAAILIQFLVAFGNVVGRTAHYTVEDTEHYTNEYVVLVGDSADGGKGTSWRRVRRIFQLAEGEGPAPGEPWVEECVQTGLSSGEGLVWAVRDPVARQERVSRRGQPAEFQRVVADEGVADKRLLLLESEFANVLIQHQRQGNTLSVVLRHAWESPRTLKSMVKKDDTRASDPHVSMIGHITPTELRRHLTATETANGFGNRLMWFCARRSQCLPFGGSPDADTLATLAERLRGAVRHARTVGEVTWADDTREVWVAVYTDLKRRRPGLAGELLSRGPAHVVRLAVLFALLDLGGQIRPRHLLAAVAVWDYAERSVRHLFGDTVGDPLADDLLRVIRAAGAAGVTKTDLSGYLGRHSPSDKLNAALGALLTHKLAHRVSVETGGRPAERWFGGPAKAGEAPQ
jgi:hypothetical protein